MFAWFKRYVEIKHAFLAEPDCEAAFAALVDHGYTPLAAHDEINDWLAELVSRALRKSQPVVILAFDEEAV